MIFPTKYYDCVSSSRQNSSVSNMEYLVFFIYDFYLYLYVYAGYEKIKMPERSTIFIW